MADLKISALTGASTPLAGTEVLPIVQSGSTVKVSVANLTAGRAVATGQLTASVTGATDKIAEFKGQNANNYIAIYDGSGTNATFGSISGGNPYIFGAAGKSISFYAGAAEKVRVNDTGNIVIVNSGNGIDFSATPGTGTSELLADYEEGTWTAVLSGSTTAGTYEFVNNNCQYTKVGRVVTLTAFLRLAGSITGGGVGNAQITGLPFEKLNNSWATGAVSFTGVAFTGVPNIAPTTSANTSTFYFAQLITGGGSGVDISGFGVGDYLNFTISYITA